MASLPNFSASFSSGVDAFPQCLLSSHHGDALRAIMRWVSERARRAGGDRVIRFVYTTRSSDGA